MFKKTVLCCRFVTASFPLDPGTGRIQRSEKGNAEETKTFCSNRGPKNNNMITAMYISKRV